MYYLEDKHPTNEYGCYIQNKGAMPYIAGWRGSSIEDVYRYIAEIEKRHNRYRQHFYIDNDFYNNKYNNSDYVYYYRFLIRKINDWDTFHIRKNLFKIVNK